MIRTGRAARRIGRRGPALAAVLAALAPAACAIGGRQPRATDAALHRVAAAASVDAWGRPVSLAPLLAGRAVLYFFRSDCPHCAPDLAAAPGLAGRSGAPALVLISREAPATLRAALRAAPPRGLVVVSDAAGAITDTALLTRFVPRVVVVVRFSVRRDVTGGPPGTLAAAMAVASGAAP